MQGSDDDLSMTSGLGEDDFRAAFAEVTSGGEKADPAPEAEAEQPAQDAAADAVEEEKPEEQEASSDSESDTDTDDEQEQETEEEAKEAAADDEDGDQDEAEDEKEEDGDDAGEDLTRELSHLPQDVRDQFADLDKKAQRLVLDRYKHLEGRADKKFKEASELRKQADEQIRTVQQIEDALKPYQQHLAEAGLSSAQAIGQVLALRDGLISDPVEGIVKIADQFMFSRGDVGSPRAQNLIRQLAKKARVDLEGLDDFDDDAPSAQPSPEAEVIAQLRREISDLKGTFDSTRQADRDMQAAQGMRLWDQFKADPANAHAERLEGEIIEQLDSPGAAKIMDPAEKLKWAYERATMVDPTAHTERLEQERAKMREEIRAERERARKEQSAAVRKVPAKKAKAASTTPKPAAPVTKVNGLAEDGDLDANAFKAVADELLGGGASRV